MNEKSLIESKMEREINKRDAVIKVLCRRELRCSLSVINLVKTSLYAE